MRTQSICINHDPQARIRRESDAMICDGLEIARPEKRGLPPYFSQTTRAACLSRHALTDTQKQGTRKLTPRSDHSRTLCESCGDKLRLCPHRAINIYSPLKARNPCGSYQQMSGLLMWPWLCVWVREGVRAFVRGNIRRSYHSINLCSHLFTFCPPPHLP